ncbi:LysR family transcriptional regulator [Flavisphingomonas formosensis]|uniref:LysR family transcriptional regulator n=1 Tax=Flavisphingomonas formosensis TaxID=861534 RepID=UPI0012F806C6|nr:LysR family transcriptional regulator [Sphingomonas formosensis]
MDSDYILFARIVAEGSLSAAGRALHLSPAMVSKRLSRLEERLGARLVHRTTRRLALTEAGRAFHADVTQILAAAEQAEARVAGLATVPRGPLRIAAPTSFGRMHVAPYLKSFLETYPEVAIDLELSDDFADLIGGRFDLAIRITGQIDPALEFHRLAANRRVLCASPSYLAEQDAPETLDDLARHRLLAASHQIPWRLESASGEQLLLPFATPLRTNSSEVVRELALSGYGIALRSTWDVGVELRLGRLLRVLPDWQGASDVAVYAVHPRAALMPANVQAMVRHLRSVYAPVPPWG